MRGNVLVLPLEHLLVQATLVLGRKGWLQRAHLVDDLAQRPNVRLYVVGLILPHLGTGVVRRARLGVKESLLGHLRYIQVA
jgi:hypothetical protein